MKFKTGLFRCFCLFGLTLMMSACGSSDYAPLGQSGRIVQGPVLNALVFADNVSAGTRFILDTTEVNTTSDSVTGDFTLPSIPAYNHILVSQGGTDKLTGQTAIQMLAPAGADNVTSLTTLVTLNPAAKTQIEALGVPFDADLSVNGTEAALTLAKAVEIQIQTFTEIITASADTAGETIEPVQLASIQSDALATIATTIAASVVDLAVPADLATTLDTAAIAVADSISTNNSNVTIDPATATAIATASTDAAVTAVQGAASVGASIAADTLDVLAEETVITPAVADEIVAEITTVVTANPVVATTTPVDYVPPTIEVTTEITVTDTTGTTGGTGSGTF